jgi:hypothetical protein
VLNWEFEESFVNRNEESKNRNAIAPSVAVKSIILDLSGFGFPFEILLVNAIGLNWIVYYEFGDDDVVCDERK